MSKIIPFDFEKFSVRVVMLDGEPWFVAADVLESLELDRKALERLDGDEKGVSSIHTLGGEQEMTIINEPGLYSLILGSRKASAKRFKKWVTGKVLPEIRKTGSFNADPMVLLNDSATLRTLLLGQTEQVLGTVFEPMVQGQLRPLFDWMLSHVSHYMESSKAALQEAQALHDAANEISLGEASHGEDFEAARELLHRRKDAIEQAQKILGTALGEMEANAALVTALKSGRNDKPLEVPLGKIADEDAIRQVRAIGLQRGDYTIDRIAGDQVLTVTPEGLDRLSKPVDREELARTKNTLDILNGGQDEDDWLPQGFARRPDLCLDLKPGVAATLAKPFAPDAGNLQQSLLDYIGGRAADGDAPGDIVADIQSSDFFQKAGDADAYREALDAVAPLKGKDGKMARAESLAESFDEMADSFVRREYGGNITTFQRQHFAPDAVAQDALHRALADEPAGVAAYKPIGELSTDDQRALRDHFYANVAHESPEAAGLRARLEKMGSIEPEKESQDMFGETSVNPDWHAWKSQRDTLAAEVGSASLDWPKYASAMRGHENAYSAIQDLIRSKVAKSFHENHNKLNPAAPLKLGRQVIRGNLNHLDAVDPEARRAREAKERELTDSLAAGSSARSILARRRPSPSTRARRRATARPMAALST